MIAVSQGTWTKKTRYAANTAAVTSICADPRPKIRRRMAQTFSGRISRPTVNRNSTTPSSATLCSSSTAATGTGPGVCGPMMMPATMKPSIDPKPSRSNRMTQMAVAARKTTTARRIDGMSIERILAEPSQGLNELKPEQAQQVDDLLCRHVLQLPGAGVDPGIGTCGACTMPNCARGTPARSRPPGPCSR